MKNVVSVLLIIGSYSVANAQNKHNLFVDVGINMRGIAATYDRKLTKHFDIGLGINTYDFSSMPYAKIRSACYVDLRPYWVIGKSMLFVFADIGAAYNSGPMPDSTTVTPISLYTTLGFGYHYRINKKGMGPYVSAGMYGYSENVHSTHAYLPPAARDYSVFEATLILSLGFKF